MARPSPCSSSKATPRFRDSHLITARSSSLATSPIVSTSVAEVDLPRRVRAADLLAEARVGLDRLEPVAAMAALRSDPTAMVIDTRSRHDRFGEGVIPGSIHIPLSVLEWRVDPTIEPTNPAITGFDQQLIVLCRDGFSSSLAAARLQRLGYGRATDLVGGYRAWLAAGLPVADTVDKRDVFPALDGCGLPEPGRS